MRRVSKAKVTAHIDREIAARPELVAIETAWRSPKEQRPGALTRHQYRELPDPDNPDAQPLCPGAKAAIIVFGKNAGRTVTGCLDDDCPVHTHHEQQHEVTDPPPSLPSAPEEATEEGAAQRKAEHEHLMSDYQAEQERREEERKAEYERQQKEYEAEQVRRENSARQGLPPSSPRLHGCIPQRRWFESREGFRKEINNARRCLMLCGVTPLQKELPR